MKLTAILICTIVAFLLFDSGGARKGGSRKGGGSWGWGWGSSGSRSSATPRPRPSSSDHGGSGGSKPGTIGWNVPQNKPTSTNNAVKPSAPVNEHAAKTSATNVQSSGYSPSGGYPRQPSNNPYQTSNANTGPVYNPSSGYNPPVGGHSPYGHGYNTPVGGHPPPYGSPMGHPPAYSPPGSQPYNPSFGHSYPSHSPSYGYGNPAYSPSIGQSPAQTILLQPNKPGIGQLAKEAFVFAGVSAGVNAAVSRLLPGGIYGHRDSGSSGGGGGGGTHTSITYNNYYNNGTAPAEQSSASAPAPAQSAAPAAAPAAAAAAPAPAAAPADSASPAPPASAESSQTAANSPQSNSGSPYMTPDVHVKKLTESLFEKDKNNAYKYITMNLQGQKKDDSKTDDAPEPFLTVKPEAYEIPTIKALLALHDNYELDVKTKEVVTSEHRREESEFLDKILETDVMMTAMKFLAEKGFIPDDEYEFKDALKRIWFSRFKRFDGDAASSGFETVFLAEQFDNDIIGLHNWIYLAKQEEAKKLNYLGYIKELMLNDKGAVVKVRLSLNDIVQPVTSVFVGTSPELEMALYTVCFFTHPNNACPISLGNVNFTIVVNGVTYFGKDILIAAYPEI